MAETKNNFTYFFVTEYQLRTHNVPVTGKTNIDGSQKELSSFFFNKDSEFANCYITVNSHQVKEMSKLTADGKKTYRVAINSSTNIPVYYYDKESNKNVLVDRISPAKTQREMNAYQLKRSPEVIKQLQNETKDVINNNLSKEVNNEIEK